jgi:hypothetical protein
LTRSVGALVATFPDPSYLLIAVPAGVAIALIYSAVRIYRGKSRRHPK